MGMQKFMMMRAIKQLLLLYDDEGNKVATVTILLIDKESTMIISENACIDVPYIENIEEKDKIKLNLLKSAKIGATFEASSQDGYIVEYSGEMTPQGEVVWDYDSSKILQLVEAGEETRFILDHTNGESGLVMIRNTANGATFQVEIEQ